MYLLENLIKNDKLIVVDIQPTYKNYFHFNLNSFSKYVQSFSDVLVLFNGPELGYENEDDLREWYDALDCDTSKIKFFEKQYGFFRDLMDSSGFDLGDNFIALGRYCIKNNIQDFRDIDKSILQKLKIEINFEDYPAYIPLDLVKELKNFGKNITIIGGGKNECLGEIEWLLEIIGITYNENNKFVY